MISQRMQRGRDHFATVAAETLVRLRGWLGLRDWVVLVREPDAWVVVAALGDLIGPAAAAWADEATGAEVGAAWAGVPLLLFGGQAGGAVYGCGVPPAGAVEVLELVGALLAAVLAAEVRAGEAAVRVREAEAASLHDPLTEVGNRRMWDRLLVTEEERCRRLGLEAAVVVVDLDGLKALNDARGHAAGDALLRTAAAVLTEHTRLPDQVARTGGDEFAIVATDCGPDDARALVQRLDGALRRAGVTGSVGHANRDARETLTRAWIAADAAMYAQKRRRRTAATV